MAFSATLANMRGLLSDAEHRRMLDLFSRAGLSMDHAQFDEEILEKGTKAILKTRDGKLRAAVPSPLGNCVFLNDVPLEEMFEAVRKHKEIVKQYPRNGEGLEAFVDSSDTGYTIHNKPVELEMNGSNGVNGAKPSVLNDDSADGIGKRLADDVNAGGITKAPRKTPFIEEAETGQKALPLVPEGQAQNGTNGVNGVNGVH